jgi:hypothetical protein
MINRGQDTHGVVDSIATVLRYQRRMTCSIEKADAATMLPSNTCHPSDAAPDAR